MLQNLSRSLKSLSEVLSKNRDSFYGEFESYDIPVEIEFHESLSYSPELEFFYRNYNFDFYGIGGLNIGFTSHENLLRR